ncbi:MAG TPA: hypothetical protein VLE91_00665 [Candidatus Saccharimonadales bacterium]|nr:hypothetical protein [Candidatus Saccharimonadales bacterium]
MQDRAYIEASSEPPASWIQSYQFLTKEAANKAMSRMRDLLLELDVDASVMGFSIKIEGTDDLEFHIALVGEEELEHQASREFQACTEEAIPSVLSKEFAEPLIARRRLFLETRTEWFEKQHQ